MTEALTLARPYARAAFELAQVAGTLREWSESLAFAASVARDPGVAALRNDPRVQPGAVVAMHLPADVGNDTPFARFLGQLAEHARLALLPEVSSLFDGFKREAESILKVKVTSALALDAGQVEQLKAALNRRFQREIVLDTAVDPDLIGGAVIDTGSEVIDGSARGRLAQLASALAQ